MTRATMSAQERVKLYSDLIRFEQQDIAASQQRIAEWARELELAAQEALK